jgi:hypothetical protein
MKKALIVEFVVRTRVCVPIPDIDDELAVRLAREKIMETPENYLFEDNAAIETDVAQPYDPQTDD